MSSFLHIPGVPNFDCEEYEVKKTKYCVLIPIINEGERIISELKTAKAQGIPTICDIIICDGDSDDGSIDASILKPLGVNTLLTKKDEGKQGAQLRMGFWWALERGYEGVITVDGNNKDSIEDISNFVNKLNDGYDFVQGSRFIKGGVALNTPIIRLIAVRFIHAPIISLTAGYWFTDTTNAFRAHSKKYLTHKSVQPFRDVFNSYELLAYLSAKASQLKLKVCEIPVKRIYPHKQKVPTKIKGFQGNFILFSILFKNLVGVYDVKRGK